MLFVPEIQFNLISISKLTVDTAMHILFTTNSCYLQDHSMRRSLHLGKRHNGLYYTLDNILLPTRDDKAFSNKASIVTFASKSSIEHAKLLHPRLGHLPFSRMKLMFPNLDVKVVQENFICSICPKARQTRISFPHSHVKSNSPFELLHVDV